MHWIPMHKSNLNLGNYFAEANRFDCHMHRSRGAYVIFNCMWFVLHFLTMNCSFDQDDSIFVCEWGFGCNFITNLCSSEQMYKRTLTCSQSQQLHCNNILSSLLDSPLQQSERKWKPKLTKQNKTKPHFISLKYFAAIHTYIIWAEIHSRTRTRTRSQSYEIKWATLFKITTKTKTLSAHPTHVMLL